MNKIKAREQLKHPAALLPHASSRKDPVSGCAEGALHIAMFGHKRIPGREGGVEIVVEELSSRIVRMGHAVTCYNRVGHHVSGAGYDEKIGKDYQGVRLKRAFTLGRGGLAAVTSSASAALLTALGHYDVVHIHAEGPAFMCWLPKLCGKRVVVTVHGLDWARAKWGRFASWYIRSGEKSAVKYADEIIVLSRNVQNYFMQNYGRDTVYIPNGVTIPEKREPERISRQFGLEKDGYVLFLGRLVPEKGVHYLIQAWKKVKTDKKLVITGGSSDTADYMEKLRQMAGENVLFTGFQQGRVLEELYSSACIYVLPSDLEGMPLSLLEAMSYGNCCLVSDIPELTEVVEDQAAVFRKGDVKDLAAHLQILLDHPEQIEKYREGAAAYVEARYSWEEMTERTLQVYRSRTQG